MANIKSNEKSARQDIKRNARNRSLKSAIKSAIKLAEETHSTADISKAVKLIDSSVTKGVYHKNKAAKMKSKVMKLANTPKKVETPVVKKEKVSTSNNDVKVDYSTMNVAQLKAAAKAKSIKGSSVMKKAELLEVLTK
jgi:small subunit ribosomal protein S20